MLSLKNIIIAGMVSCGLAAAASCQENEFGTVDLSGYTPVPEVTITVDGKKLNIPAQPIMSTNANGYTECNHYQLYAPLKAGSKVKADANNPDVKFDISPVVAGRATVKATYNGQEKIFLIN